MKWEPTLVFSAGKSYGQRSQEGYSPLGLRRVGYDLATKQQVSRKPSIMFLKILPTSAIAQYQGHFQL